MYDWLVGAIGAGGTLGLVFGGLLLLFLLSLGVLSWQVRRLKKSYSVPVVPYGEVQAAAVAAAVANFGKQPPLGEEEKTTNEPRRLTLCDSVMIDDERRLVLIRRDDVEHLIMVGSAGDMVIEHNIPVEPPPLDAVSMLAIARAEETPFMMLDGHQEESQETAQQGLESATKAEEEAGETTVDTPFFSLDESPSPSETSPEALPVTEDDILSDRPSGDINLTHEGDLAAGVASLFPERVASALPNSLAVSPHLGLQQTVPPQAAPQEKPQGQIQGGQHDISALPREEPPLASYFAGGPKKTIETRPTVNPQPQTMPAAPSRPPLSEPTQAAASPALSLNPFIRATPPVGKEAAPVPSVEASDEQKEAATPTQSAPTPTVPAAPSSPSSPSFINSFLGFPLEQLTKTGTVSPASKAHSPLPSQPKAAELKAKDS